MSISVTNQATFAPLQQIAEQRLASMNTPVPAAAQSSSTNSYGTITQTYKTEAALNDSESATFNLNAITASSASQTSVGRGVLAVAQAIKAATPVDTGTGLKEISASATANLTNALFKYFMPLIGDNSNSFLNTVETGGLSQDSLNSDIATAVKQFSSGAKGGAFSLTLSADTTTTWNDGGSSPSGPAKIVLPTVSVQGATVIQQKSVLSLSFGQDGQISGNYISNELQFNQGTAIMQGVKGADAALPPGMQFFNGHVATTGIMPLSVVAEPSGSQETAGTSISFNDQSQTEVQLPTAVAQAPNTVQISTDRAGSGTTTTTFDQNRFDYAAEAALATVTAVADAERKNSTLTIGMAATTTMAVGLTYPNGSSSFVYNRPDGTLGRINLGTTNQVA